MACEISAAVPEPSARACLSPSAGAHGASSSKQALAHQTATGPAARGQASRSSKAANHGSRARQPSTEAEHDSRAPQPSTEAAAKPVVAMHTVFSFGLTAPAPSGELLFLVMPQILDNSELWCGSSVAGTSLRAFSFSRLGDDIMASSFVWLKATSPGVRFGSRSSRSRLAGGLAATRLTTL